MKRKTGNTPELDILDFFYYANLKKIILILFGVVGIIFGNLYSIYDLNNKNIKSKTEIILESPPFEFFASYNELFFNIDYLDKFYERKFNVNMLNMFKYPIFQKNLIQNKTLFKFDVANEDDINKYRNLLSIESKSNSTIHSYTLLHPHTLNGAEFFEYYVEFVKDNTLDDIKNLINFSFEKKIEKLNFSRKNVDFMLEFMMSKNKSISNGNISEYTKMYDKYKKEEIEFYKKKYNEFKSLNLDYNPILYINSEEPKIDNEKKRIFKYSINGLILGLIFGFIYLFFKYVLVLQKKIS